MLVAVSEVKNVLKIMSSNKTFVKVETEYGPIHGCQKESVLGRTFFNFQKIPYMAPPVGKLRFRDPQAPQKWNEPLDCTEEGSPFCNVNFLDGAYEGDLDAMFINVYTNNIKPLKPYPVLVWVRREFFFKCFLVSVLKFSDSRRWNFYRKRINKSIRP